MMKSLRLRRNSAASSTPIRTLLLPSHFAAADSDAALLEPIDEEGTPDVAAANAAFDAAVAKGSRSQMKSERSPSSASLATCTTESSSSTHSVIEAMAAMGADEEGGGDGAPRPTHRQRPASATTNGRKRVIRGRRQGGCLRVKTQQASLQQKFTAAATAGRKSLSASSSRAEDKNETEYFDAKTTESELLLKTVGFSHITVHSHQLILGDNPSPTTGPPVSIEWTAFDTVTVPLDDYEKSRAGPPRHHSELQAPGGLRTAWLLRAGYTLEEIATAEKQVRVIQRRRLASLPSHNHHPATSPYNPCGKANQQVRRGLAKLLPRTWARRKAHDDAEAEAVAFVDEA